MGIYEGLKEVMESINEMLEGLTGEQRIEILKGFKPFFEPLFYIYRLLELFP